MIWLVAIGAVLFLFYWWLSGHWFARVLIWIVFGAVIGVCIGGALGSPPAIVMGFLPAWFLAGIPQWVIGSRMADPIGRGVSVPFSD